MVARPSGLIARWISMRSEKSVNVVRRITEKIHLGYCFASPEAPIRCISRTCYEAQMSPTRLLLLPGSLVCDALHVDDTDSRTMLRTLVNMLAWNLIAVLAVLPFI